MGRPIPSPLQNFLSSVILPLLSIFLLPISLTAVCLVVLHDKLVRGRIDARQAGPVHPRRCVMISGGRMSKGLTLVRAFHRAGWEVIGVEEEGWGDLCPMRFSSAVDHFYPLPLASSSYDKYSARLLSIAQKHHVELFIPVSGAGSSVEDAQAAESMYTITKGTCRTFIQDPETMLDLHEKDRFMSLVDRLGITIPAGRRVESVEEAVRFLRKEGRKPRFVLKCMALDDNRGDMTLFPLEGDNHQLERTKALLERLSLKISKTCPYVFQEFISGQEYCTHASVINGQITSFVACPSNDMLMTYDNHTSHTIGRRAEEWTQVLLDRLQADPLSTGKRRQLTGHFSFDLILSLENHELYPIECNARVHTAIILLPLDQIASCYSSDSGQNRQQPLRPTPDTAPRSWCYNDLVMRYLPLLIPLPKILSLVHPSLPACLSSPGAPDRLPKEDAFMWRVDPTLVADDWLPFLVLWHGWWPTLLLTRWWAGKRWTRLNVSTGRIFEG